MSKLRIVRSIFFLAGLFFVFSGMESFTQAEEKWTAAQLEFFEKKVRPVFVEHCQQCHGEKEQEGKFRIDSRMAIVKGGESGPAIIPGAAKQSELILAINHDPDGYQMPPENKLSADQIAAITKWVDQGAAWTKSELETQNHQEEKFVLDTNHWSLQPIVKPEVPKVKQAGWASSPVDRFILSRLEQASLSPCVTAKRAILARRVYFDLIGLPPTPAQVEKFQNNKSENAFGQMVDELLASPHYGERWGRHWLDLVRFAETMGHEYDFEISHTSHYRDYVIRAFNEDIPFDQFTWEHFAGDLLAKPRYRVENNENESIIATGFFWLGQGKHSPVDIRAEKYDLIDNQIDVLSKAFLGTSVACARCHDHKFDPISIKDYYAISGIMESSRRQFADIRNQKPLNQTVHQIHELKQNQHEALVKQSSEQLQKFLTKLDQPETIIDWKNPDLNQLDHPLHPWRQLRQLDDPQKFQAEKNRLLKQFVAHNNNRKQAETASVVFANFEARLPAGWSEHGQAFLQSESEYEKLVISPDPWKPVLALPGKGCLHSGTASKRAYGVLRSPTFLIDQPFIDYHICRSGGDRLTKNRHRGQLKKGHVHLVIDGFQHIKNPIYGSLSMQVQVASQPTWHRQNVEKWVGHRAYIEIFDEENGFVEIDQIRFSSGNKQVEAISSEMIAMLKQKQLQTPDAIKISYLELLARCLNRFRQCDDKQVALSAEERILVNWMLKQLKRNSMEMQRPDWLDQFYLDLKSLESQLGHPILALATTEGSGLNAPLLIRGNSKKPAGEVPRRYLEIMGGTSSQIPAHSSGRLQFAQSITSKENPLFDRVIVNRVWEHHFGRGIVATPDDFGKMGLPPSHPELLDYLAIEFRDHGRSVKWLHRFLLNTSTYQMQSNLREEVQEIDPQNRLWHRMPVRRLEGEAIRDAMLAVSGKLRSELYGPSVPPFLTPFMQGRGRPSRSGPLDGNGRRSIYINVRRNFLTPMFLAFDYPLPMTTTGKRSVSNVPAQALTMMNNEFTLQQANLWAQAILKIENQTNTSRIRIAYQQAYSRLPSNKETENINRFIAVELQKNRMELDIWSDICHVLFNVKEFVFIL